MMAMELARDLKVAGLPWKPRRGDLTMDRLNDLFVVLQDGSDDAGGVAIDTGAGAERRHYLMLTWIPRLEQALAFLARYGPCTLSARAAGAGRKDVRWRLEVYPPPPPSAGAPSNSAPAAGAGRAFEASDPADAAGRALHHLLTEEGWRPGPALSGW
jgi:hypothetical protein